MSAQRTEALLCLQADLLEAAPGLSICPWPVPPQHKLKFPSLGIVPVRWKYNPHQAVMTQARTPEGVVNNLGHHEALIQLRLVGSNPIQRADYEEKIINAFTDEENLRPGVLICEVDSIAELGTWRAAWTLEEEEWQDERAFDNEFWSIISLTGVLPWLRWRAAPDIRDLRLGSATSPSQAFDDPGVTRIRVNADGTVTPLP